MTLGEHFPYLGFRDLTAGDRARLTQALSRTYPELRDPEPEAALDVGGFYPGFLLVEFRSRGGGSPRLALADPATGQVYLVDSRGEAFDRVDAIAPLTLTATNVVSYLRLRFSFMQANGGNGFGLAGAPGDVMSRSDGNFDVSVPVFKTSHDATAQSAEATVSVRASDGIVNVQRLEGNQWDDFTPDPSVLLAHYEQFAEVTRVVTPYFVNEWRETRRRGDFVNPARSIQGEIHDRRFDRVDFDNLLDHFGIGVDDGKAAEAIVRFAPLAFYRTFHLFEVIVPRAKEKPGYCLGRPLPNGEGWDFLWLDGKSDSVYAANEAKTRDGSTELDLDAQGLEDRVAEYIRFFCWALATDDGTYSTPERLERLELTHAPAPKVRAALDATGLLETMRRPEADELLKHGRPKSDQLRWGIVIYGSEPFDRGSQPYRCLFSVQSTDGLVEMLDDEAIPAGELAVDVASMRADGRLRWRADTPKNDTPAGFSAALVSKPPEEVRKPTRTDDPGVITYSNYTLTLPVDLRTWFDDDCDCAFVDCRFEAGIDLHNVRTKRSLSFRDCTFFTIAALPSTRDRAARRSALDLAGAHIGGSLSMDGCVFEPLSDALADVRPDADDPSNATARKAGKALDLGDSHIGASLHLRNCTLRGGVSLRNARVDQSVSILGCSMLIVRPPREDRSRPLDFLESDDAPPPFLPGPSRFDIDGTYLMVGHNVTIGENTAVSGLVDLGGAQIGRDLRVSGFSARAITAVGLQAYSIQFQSIRLDDENPESGAQGQLDLSHARIAASVDFLACAIAGELNMFASRTAGNVTFTETRIGRGLAASFATVGLFFSTASQRSWSFSASGLDCIGDLDLSGAKIGVLELSGAQVDGAVRLYTGTFGCLYFRPALRAVRLLRGVKPVIEVARVRWLLVKNAVIRDDLRLHAMRIGDLPRSLFGRMAQWLDPRFEAGIRIENSRIGGNLTTLPDRKSLAQAIEEGHAADDAERNQIRTFLGSLGSEMRALVPRTVVGALNLRANTFDGTVELSDLTVLGALILAGSTIGIDLNVSSERPIMDGKETGLVTRCVEADFEKIRCRGDADLTGLNVDRAVEDPTRSPLVLEVGSGDLKCRDANVKGDVLLYRDDTRHAKISGEADLAALVANKVILSSVNVPSRSDHAAGDTLRRQSGTMSKERARVILERAKLSRLEIRKPPHPPMDLTAIEVARWNFAPHARDTSDGNDADDIVNTSISVLRKMEPNDLGVWLAVERELRNQGLDSAANKIYREMRRHQRVSLSGVRRLLRSAADFFQWVTIAYGTQPWRPFVLSFLFSLLLIAILAEPNNIQPSADLVQAHGKTCVDLARNSPFSDDRLGACEKLSPQVLHYSWTALDGLNLAVHYAVPVIDLFNHDEWKATHRDLTIKVPSLGRPVQIPLPVDMLAGFTAFLGWIAWPILFLLLGSRVVRGQRA